MLLDMVALFYLEWDQFDFKTAFLNGELNIIGGGSIWRPLKGVEEKEHGGLSILFESWKFESRWKLLKSVLDSILSWLESHW